MLVFMVAEKPALAETIANVLSDGRCSSRRGFNGACHIHEWRGHFQNRQCLFRMTSVCGHVMNLDFVGKYNRWDAVEPIELFHAPIQKKEANPNLKMPAFLSKEAQGSNFVVLWLDCDLEGENICFEVLFSIRDVWDHSDDCIYRAHFSSITEPDLKEAFRTLRRPSANEAMSVDARQELDLRIGCAFTRFQTIFFKNKYDGLDSNCVSYGPCQTPSLAFCVGRYDDIQSFRPEDHWTPFIECDVAGDTIRFRYVLAPVFQRDVAAVILKLVQSARNARIDKIKTERKRRSAPCALNTVELLRAASTGLGIGSSETMAIAERLYTQGLISYPRTETTRYPNTFNYREAVGMFRKHAEFGQAVDDILKDSGSGVPKRGKDCGDHPPITPVGLPTKPLFGDQQRIYDYVVRHFLSSLSRDCIYDDTHVVVKVSFSEFEARCRTEIDPGWLSSMPWKRKSEGEDASQALLATLTEGQQLPIKNSGLKEGRTSAPGYLTESELISLMEKHGIGTDASIPVHIKNIVERRYVSVEGSRRQLVPTQLGLTLVHGYQKIDPELCQSHMRSAIEKELRLIAKGEALFNDVLNHVLRIYEEKFKYFTGNIEIMDRLFEDSFTPLSEAGRAVSRCGVCRRFMRLAGSTEQRGSSLRLHCANCRQTYAMPVTPGLASTIRPYNDERCPIDDFDLVFSVAENGKSQVLCPLCFNDPPYPSMVPRSLSCCAHCPHLSCPHSFNANGVSACYSCDTGVLVLDITCKPRFKISCSDCPLSISLPKQINRSRVTNKQCQTCGCYLLSTNLETEATDGGLKCLLCDPTFHPAVQRSLQQDERGGPPGGRGFRTGRRLGRNAPASGSRRSAGYRRMGTPRRGMRF